MRWFTWFFLLAIFALFANPVYPENFYVRVRFVPDPVQVGNELARITAVDSSGAPTSGLPLYLRTWMPNMTSMPTTLGIRPWPSREISPGEYEIPFQLPMLGLWRLDLLLEKAGHTSKTLFSIQKTLKPQRNRLTNFFITLIYLLMEHTWLAAGVLLLALAFILLHFFFFPNRFTVAIPFLIFFFLVGAGYLSTQTLKKSTYPREEAYESMEMKMNMNAPDMGMSNRILSAPRAVSVETVKPQSISETATYSGIVAADQEETVYPRVTGWLLSMPFYPGMKVRAGEVVGELDTSELDPLTTQAGAKYRASIKAVQASQFQLLQKKSEVKKSIAELDYWKTEIKREKYLLGQGAISQQEYDQEENQYQLALNTFHAAVQAEQAASEGLAQNQALEQAAGASLQEASTIEGYATLRSHLNGVVTERLINEGVLVHPGMGILKISEIDFVRLQADVAESDLDKIRVGMPVLIRSPKLGERVWNGKVTSLFYHTDPETHTGKVEARIANKGHLLFPGDYVSMTFWLTTRPHALAVDSSAVLPFQEAPETPNLPALEKKSVWIEGKDGLAHRRDVVTGISDGERTEIVKGLAPGDRVIVSGMQDLQEMDPVTEVKGEAP